MKIACIIAARMASTRLPRKIMMAVLGKPMLEQQINRIKRCKLINEIVIATTTQPEDDVIVKLAKKLKVKSYRGSVDDILERTLKAAQSVNADVIVQINGDCPLIDPKLIDELIQSYLDKKPDYATNSRIEQTFPTGLDVEVFSTESLDEINRTTNDPFDREHVTLYYYEHPEKYKILSVTAPPKLRRPELRWTVDTKKDLEFVRVVYKELYPKKPNFSAEDVIEVLDRKPELKEINMDVKQREARGENPPAE